jgi:hypothetical protein
MRVVTSEEMAKINRAGGKVKRKSVPKLAPEIAKEKSPEIDMDKLMDGMRDVIRSEMALFFSGTKIPESDRKKSSD